MSDAKHQIMQQAQQVAAIQNAKTLVDSVQNICFKKCVQKPSSALSSGDEKCFTNCMEKYMAAWNTVSREYIAKLQAEQARGNMLGLQSVD